MNRRRVSNFAKYYPISIVFDFVLNYWQSKTYISKQRGASAIPATCHILVPPLPGTQIERTREETRENVGNEKIGKVREMGGKESGRGT